MLGGDVGSEVAPDRAAALLEWVDLVSIAGAEAEAMQGVVREAVGRRVQVGVSVERAEGNPGVREVRARLEEQVGALQRVVSGAGGRAGHVKLRGSLREACDERTELAEACVDWMESELEGVPLIVGAGGLLHAVAEARGVPLLREICAGRVYSDEARLVPRTHPGCLIDDAKKAALLIEEWKKTGYLAVANGRRWLVEAETISVVADSPLSLEIARSVREVLGERAET